MTTEKKPSNRISKLNSLIQQQLGAILPEYLEQPGLVTINKVEVSRDLKWAKVWLSILNGDDAAIVKELEKNIYDIQGELNRGLTLKVLPRLQFFLDTSARYAQHIDELIKKIHGE